MARIITVAIALLALTLLLGSALATFFGDEEPAAVSEQSVSDVQ